MKADVIPRFEAARDAIVTESESERRIGNLRVFLEHEILMIINSFVPQRVIGEGGYGKVYLGELKDGQKVAVKEMFQNNPKQNEQFITEIMLLSSLRHKNLVKIIGCSSPFKRDLNLIYEFVSNGTLSYHLYGEPAPTTTLPWSLRIRIAIETAEALVYLHSVPNKLPIVHNDIKSDNILLDNSLRVKVADFGLCRLFPMRTGMQGTTGYRAPEYSGRQKPTYKTDVYSFGVVLLELVSGKPAIDVDRVADNGDMCDVYLFQMAEKMIGNKQVDKLVDVKLGYLTDGEIRRMMDTVAELAMRCLQTKGKKRPPMVEVVRVLKEIRDEIVQMEKAEGVDMVTDDIDAAGEQIDTGDDVANKSMEVSEVYSKGCLSLFCHTVEVKTS